MVLVWTPRSAFRTLSAFWSIKVFSQTKCCEPLMSAVTTRRLMTEHDFLQNKRKQKGHINHAPYEPALGGRIWKSGNLHLSPSHYAIWNCSRSPPRCLWGYITPSLRTDARKDAVSSVRSHLYVENRILWLCNDEATPKMLPVFGFGLLETREPLRGFYWKLTKIGGRTGGYSNFG
jgi:hypothetical protein